MLNPILNTGGAVRSPVKAFYGINRKKYAHPGECVSCLNVDGDEFPILRSVKENKSVLTSEEEITKLLPPDEGEEMKLIGLVGGEVVGYGEFTSKASIQKTRTDIIKIGDKIITIPEFAEFNLTDEKVYDRGNYKYARIDDDWEGAFVNVRSGDDIGVYYFFCNYQGEEGDSIDEKISYLKVKSTSSSDFYRWIAEEKEDYFIIKGKKKIHIQGRSGSGDHICYVVHYYKKNEEGTYKLTDNEQLSAIAPHHESKTGNGTLYWISTAYEDIPLACVHQNRLWGVSGDGSEVRCSKLGEPTNFTDYNSGAASAWFTAVGSEGKFTGIIPYNNSIFAFKASCIHVIYGTVPQNYSMEKTFDECGCIDGDSIIVVNNALYWLGYNGIYRYAGGTPKIISEQLNKRYKKCVSFSDNEKLYLNLTDYDGNSELLCYDTLKGLWHGFPYLDFTGGFLFDGKLYAYTKNELFEISGGEYGQWCFESVLEYYEGFENCSATEIYLRAELKAGSGVKVEYKGISQSEWENCGEYIADSDCMIKEKFVLRFRNDKAYQFKIQGSGEAYIYELERTVSGSGRKNF